MTLPKLIAVAVALAVGATSCADLAPPPMELSLSVEIDAFDALTGLQQAEVSVTLATDDSRELGKDQNVKLGTSFGWFATSAGGVEGQTVTLRLPASAPTSSAVLVSDVRGTAIVTATHGARMAQEDVIFSGPPAPLELSLSIDIAPFDTATGLQQAEISVDVVMGPETELTSDQEVSLGTSFGWFATSDGGREDVALTLSLPASSPSASVVLVSDVQGTAIVTAQHGSRLAHAEVPFTGPPAVGSPQRSLQLSVSPAVAPANGTATVDVSIVATNTAKSDLTDELVQVGTDLGWFAWTAGGKETRSVELKLDSNGTATLVLLSDEAGSAHLAATYEEEAATATVVFQ